jgi:hypothetical protein
MKMTEKTSLGNSVLLILHFCAAVYVLKYRCGEILCRYMYFGEIKVIYL